MGRREAMIPSAAVGRLATPSRRLETGVGRIRIESAVTGRQGGRVWITVRGRHGPVRSLRLLAHAVPIEGEQGNGDDCEGDGYRDREAGSHGDSSSDDWGSTGGQERSAGGQSADVHSPGGASEQGKV
jgi:hypothetical protein